MTKSSWVAGTAAILALAAGAAAHGSERSLTLDAAASKVSFELPATGHDVHGLFALKSGRIAFDAETGVAQGEIVVDAASAVSGNGTRDETMREDVLEANRFPEIRFVAERFQGLIPESGESDIELGGTIHLHGTAHPLTLKAHVTTAGTHLEAKTEFPVAFIDWGLKDPSIFFLRVEPVVRIKVQAVGELAPAAVVAGGS